MPVLYEILPREYRDSLVLMQLAAALAKMPGIAQASAVMGTPGNLDLLRQAGMETGDISAGPSDLVIAVRGEKHALHGALAEARAQLSASTPVADAGSAEKLAPRSIAMALAGHAQASLVVISTPGEYAVAEALKALNLGLNVMLFSSNVSIADEAMLKRTARDKGLIVMGPDCGTAIINGIPLAFANVVKRGPIGVIGASGTGLQEVTVLVDRLGSGISHAIGTGGRDLSAEIGGISMLTGLKYLADDGETAVIVLISKPPAPEIADRILASARACGKPVVVLLQGADPRAYSGGSIHGVRTLAEAARAAVVLSRGHRLEVADETIVVPAGIPALAASQKYIRGLFSGGTFAFEATMLLQESLAVHSNTHVGKSLPLGDVFRSEGHTIVDLGDDIFTRGRPHPMIDQRLRIERIMQEAADPDLAVLLLDVVLGFGSHPDPAAELAPALRSAHAIAAQAGRAFICIGHVCGTDSDPQGRASQIRVLHDAGMILADNNAHAARLARKIVG
jgi:FdrA protein